MEALRTQIDAVLSLGAKEINASSASISERAILCVTAHDLPAEVDRTLIDIGADACDIKDRFLKVSEVLTNLNASYTLSCKTNMVLFQTNQKLQGENSLFLTLLTIAQEKEKYLNTLVEIKDESIQTLTAINNDLLVQLEWLEKGLRR